MTITRSNKIACLALNVELIGDTFRMRRVIDRFTQICTVPNYSNLLGIHLCYYFQLRGRNFLFSGHLILLPDGQL